MSSDTQLNPKLGRRLKLALLATLLAVLVLATIAAGVSAYFEASDIQDETLLSIANLVETNQMGLQQENKSFKKGRVDDSAVRIWQMGKANRHGFSFKKSLKAGFHTVHEGDDFWRVFVTKKNQAGEQFVVAQQLSVSAELAFQSASNTAIPLLLLFLFIPALISLVVWHSFKPLNALTKKVGSSESLTLDLTDKKEIPVEVLPFVSAIDTLLEKNKTYNAAQRRFIADAAHELRTPITALSLEIENVQSAKDESVKIERQAALAKSVSRLQRLVNQLLDLARAQSATEDNKAVVSFNELVKTQIAELYWLAEDKDIDISVNRNEPADVLDTNNQLQHIVRNALSNAIKFTPNGGDITIELYSQHEQAVFCVIDSGPGVPNEHLTKLHEPFYRPDGEASGKGAGLGLAICHEIATRLSGQLSFENQSPNGFKFCYQQPLA